MEKNERLLKIRQKRNKGIIDNNKKSKIELENDDLFDVLEEIHEVVDSGQCYRSTQNIVNAALDLIIENKCTYGTFDMYILNRFMYDFPNEYKNYDYVMDNKIRVEDCVLFFKQHGFTMIKDDDFSYKERIEKELVTAKEKIEKELEKIAIEESIVILEDILKKLKIIDNGQIYFEE